MRYWGHSPFFWTRFLGHNSSRLIFLNIVRWDKLHSFLISYRMAILLFSGFDFFKKMSLLFTPKADIFENAILNLIAESCWYSGCIFVCWWHGTWVLLSHRRSVVTSTNLSERKRKILEKTQIFKQNLYSCKIPTGLLMNYKKKSAKTVLLLQKNGFFCETVSPQKYS